MKSMKGKLKIYEAKKNHLVAGAAVSSSSSIGIANSFRSIIIFRYLEASIDHFYVTSESLICAY